MNKFKDFWKERNTPKDKDLPRLKELKRRMLTLYNKLQSMKHSDVWDFEAEGILQNEIVNLRNDFINAGGTQEDFETLKSMSESIHKGELAYGAEGEIQLVAENNFGEFRTRADVERNVKEAINYSLGWITNKEDRDSIAAIRQNPSKMKEIVDSICESSEITKAVMPNEGDGRRSRQGDQSRRAEELVESFVNGNISHVRNEIAGDMGMFIEAMRVIDEKYPRAFDLREKFMRLMQMGKSMAKAEDGVEMIDADLAQEILDEASQEFFKKPFRELSREQQLQLIASGLKAVNKNMEKGFDTRQSIEVELKNAVENLNSLITIGKGFGMNPNLKRTIENQQKYITELQEALKNWDTKKAMSEDEHFSDKVDEKKVREVWDKMNDNEKFGVRFAMFPSWALDYKLSHGEISRLMEIQRQEKPSINKSIQKAMVDDIMAWEDGSMSEEEEIKFFQKLVNSGMAWSLQGMYGRRAEDLIRAGLVKDPRGHPHHGTWVPGTKKSMEKKGLTSAERYNRRLNEIFDTADRQAAEQGLLVGLHGWYKPETEEDKKTLQDILNRMEKSQYGSELGRLKPHDEVQGEEPRGDGTIFISTAGHGYLAVPRSHPRFKEAEKIVQYGYKGSQAVYLEEDVEMGQFLQKGITDNLNKLGDLAEEAKDADTEKCKTSLIDKIKSNQKKSQKEVIGARKSFKEVFRNLTA